MHLVSVVLSVYFVAAQVFFFSVFLFLKLFSLPPPSLPPPLISSSFAWVLMYLCMYPSLAAFFPCTLNCVPPNNTVSVVRGGTAAFFCLDACVRCMPWVEGGPEEGVNAEFWAASLQCIAWRYGWIYSRLSLLSFLIFSVFLLTSIFIFMVSLASPSICPSFCLLDTSWLGYLIVSL